MLLKFEQKVFNYWFIYNFELFFFFRYENELENNDLKKAVAPFIKWLEEAEEDSGSEDS